MFRNLKNALYNKQISMKTYADLLGVSEKTALNKLNGTTEFTLSEIMKLSKCVFPEYSFDYLFTYSSENDVSTSSKAS